MNLILYIINICLYLTAIATWLIIPESLTLNVGTTVFSCLMTVFLMYLRRNDLKIYWESGRFKNFLNSATAVFLVVAILGLINYLGVKHPWHKDLTVRQANSLSPKTQNILKEVKGPLLFRVFSRRADQVTILPLLSLYRLYKSDIEFELIDPDLQPEKVQGFGVTKYGTVVVQYGNRRQTFLDHSELSITQAILKVARPKDPVFYFTTGHQEANLNGEDQQGISHLKTLLTSQSFSLKEVNLAQVKEVPQDADGLIILGPKAAFFPEEIKSVEKYVEGGGRILIGIDPEFNKNSLKDLAKVFEQWGLSLGNDLVVDLKSYVNGSQFTVPLVTHYDNTHPITQKFQEQTFFPLAASISVSSLPGMEEKFKITKLAQTNSFPASWAERNFAEVVAGNLHYTQGQDEKGPVSIMAAAEEKNEGKGKKKIVAIGNSTFIQNIYKNYDANFTLFINALSWLIDEEFSISGGKDSISDKKENGPFLLSAPQVGLIFYFSMIFCPLILLIAACYLYKRRQSP